MRLGLLALAGLLWLPACVGAQTSSAATCVYDRTAMLALSQDAFDQDPNGGWRPLANKPQCEIAAADLIRDYRTHHGLEDGILYWHEGQLRASAGQVAQAIPLMERSRGSSAPWNHYMDATVSFLRRDRPGLDRARASLAALPQPPGFAELVASAQRDFGMTPTWPMNLDVVDALVRCFDKPYREAYGGTCRTPPPQP